MNKWAFIEIALNETPSPSTYACMEKNIVMFWFTLAKTLFTSIYRLKKEDKYSISIAFLDIFSDDMLLMS